jgi:hypothetical protein
MAAILDNPGKARYSLIAGVYSNPIWYVVGIADGLMVITVNDLTSRIFSPTETNVV